ncbi:MAG: hypothetical protein ACTSRD_01775 [Promethearchaeota archaeon]
MKTRSRLLIIVVSFVFLMSAATFGICAEETYGNVIWISGFDSVKGEWDSIVESDDLYDIITINNTDEVQYQINGTQDKFNLTVSGAPNASDWIETYNPRFPGLPSNYELTNEGWYANHTWGDTIAGQQADQSTSIHWSNEITMDLVEGDDMSDYIIINASVGATVNGSVQAVGDGTSGGIDTPGDEPQQATMYDYVRFYILLTDPSGEKEYEIASYQTETLGNDTEPINDLFDTLMETVDENDLNFYLTSVLNTDYEKFNITVGIFIFSDDNWGTDYDYWNDLLIKDFSLSFDYKRKIDQFTKATWVGTGDKLSSVIGNRTDVLNVQVLNATLSYSYKIDDPENENPWPTSSPNSEFRTFVNNKQLSETIKLRFATNTSQEAKPSGYDVSSLITNVDENITIGIQVYIADDFEFSDVLNISITSIELKISYLLTIQDPIPPDPTNYKPYIYGSVGLLAALASGIGLYEGIFKFPAAVRTVRSLKRKVRRGKTSKPIHGNDSNTLGRNIFEEEKRHLNKVSNKPQHSQPSKKAAPKKDASNYKDVSPPEQKKLPEKKIEGSEKNA